MVLCSISYITGTTRVPLLSLHRNHHHFFAPSPSKRVREYNLSYRGQSVDSRSVSYYPTIIAILLVTASCPSPPLPPLLSHDYIPKLILPLRQWQLPRKNRSRIMIIFPIRICPCCSLSWLRPQFIHVPGLRYVTSADDGIMSTASPVSISSPIPNSILLLLFIRPEEEEQEDADGIHHHPFAANRFFHYSPTVASVICSGAEPGIDNHRRGPGNWINLPVTKRLSVIAHSGPPVFNLRLYYYCRPIDNPEDVIFQSNGLTFHFIVGHKIPIALLHIFLVLCQMESSSTLIAGQAKSSPRLIPFGRTDALTTRLWSELQSYCSSPMRCSFSPTRGGGGAVVVHHRPLVVTLGFGLKPVPC